MVVVVVVVVVGAGLAVVASVAVVAWEVFPSAGTPVVSGASVVDAFCPVEVVA